MDNNNFKEEVKKIADKRILTAFIYCLDQIEKDFGYLWGEEKEDNELTEEEKKMYEVFLTWRTKILDYGNIQRRLAKKEINKL